MRGVSLIEILIVLTIMGVVSALAYPAMSSAMAEQRLHTGANDIVQVLQFARFQAVLRGRPYVVQVSTTDDRPGGSLRVFEGQSPWSCTDLAADPSRTLVLPGSHDEGDVGLNLHRPTGSICFKPDGRAYDTNGQPPSMPVGAQATFNVVRSGNIGFLLRRYEGEGGGMVARGVPKRVVLSHLGMAYINTDITERED